MALTEQSASVSNQPPPLEGYNVFLENRPLVEALEREGGGWAHEECARLGERSGRAETLRLGDLANEHPPVLRENDEVEFHPAWHELMRIGVEAGLTGFGWDGKPGGHVARAAMFMTLGQVEAGDGCPLSRTHAPVPAGTARQRFTVRSGSAPHRCPMRFSSWRRRPVGCPATSSRASFPTASATGST